MSSILNEDCLFLDVFAPSNAHSSSKLPVWFFIQGGGYAANSDQNFNASEVIVRSNHSMVFVQINYRVGAFGFLASEKIRENGDLNVGLLDQQKALLWVQKYIHLVSLHFISLPVAYILTRSSSSVETQTMSLSTATQPAAAPSPIT